MDASTGDNISAAVLADIVWFIGVTQQLSSPSTANEANQYIISKGRKTLEHISPVQGILLQHVRDSLGDMSWAISCISNIFSNWDGRWMETLRCRIGKPFLKPVSHTLKFYLVGSNSKKENCHQLRILQSHTCLHRSLQMSKLLQYSWTTNALHSLLVSKDDVSYYTIHFVCTMKMNWE